MARLAAIVCGLMFVLSPAQVLAQGFQRPQTSPFNQPPVSPYLNMLRSGSPASNYYNLVRPQMDTAATLQRLQQQPYNQAYPGPAMGGEGLSITGHPARFMNFSHYYYYNLGTQTPVSGIRPGVGGGGIPAFAGGYQPSYGAGLPRLSFITGTFIP